MGNKLVTFSEEQLEEYQDCTFFGRKEILDVYKKFVNLSPAAVPEIMTRWDCQNFRLSRAEIEGLPELKENPYRRRIITVFSEDGSGEMSFNDFLEMFSVFCERAPKELKAYYAFRIYDYDEDGFLSLSDIAKTLRALCRDSLEEKDRRLIADRVMKECNMDDNGAISFSEFENMVTKSAEFAETFHIRI
ncbi:putative Calcium and integrin-binding family member 2 [Hypsibius exemplaris]|uniref:Calcium and integrin-binding family member 2 n=1 Tax=Hypsibius exemplaris TaxID=2072580 RepID=A0A1W0XAF4_HYPEX|nr:putative Calcium and integrin-binding family member 2 [Hypsibius exemplaris]